MIEFKPVIIHDYVSQGIPATFCELRGIPVAVVGTIGNFYGPAGLNEKEAQARLLEYMQSDVGMKHYREVHPEANEQEYQELLFELYEMEDVEYFRNSLTDGFIPPEEQKSPS